MNCNICFESFDEAERRPKTLHCGHTFCLKCLLDIRARATTVLCPVDRSKVAVSDPRQLPDTFTILSFIAKGRPSPQRLFWCLDCDKDAVSACIDQHSICSLKKGRLQKVEAKVADLQKSSGVDVVSKLLQKLAILQQGGGGQLIDAQEAALEEDHKKVQAAIESLYKALELPGNGWQAALQSLEAEAKTSSEKLPTWEGALQLLSMEDIDFSVGNDRAGKWNGKLQLTDAASLPKDFLKHFRQVLFRLQMRGALTKTTEGTDHGLKVAQHEIRYMNLCDQPAPPYSDEDTLDMSLFHDTFGFTNVEYCLQQILESRKKVRKVFGLGRYAYAICETKYPAQLKNDYHYQFVWHGISRVLEVHHQSVEEMSLTTRCLAHLHSALRMPNLRKLQIYLHGRVCRCSTCAQKEPVPVSAINSSIQCVQLVVSTVGTTASKWLSAVLRCGSAALREVIVSGVPLPVFPAVWSDDWSWFPGSLKQCQRLQSITLTRSDYNTYSACPCPGGPVCAAQLSALRSASGGKLTARCKDCHRVLV